MSNIFENYFSNTNSKKNNLEKNIDFTGLFDVLSDLFEKLNINNKDKVKPDKISFRLAYADYNFSDEIETAVVFRIVERKPLILNTSAGNITQVKPIVVSSEYDLISDQVVETEMRSFEHIIALTVFSTSHKQAYNVARYIETVFTVYRGYLQKHFRNIVYLGFKEDVAPANLYNNKMFPITMMFKIVTDETARLLYEPIQDITISI